MDIRQITATYFVSPQLDPSDFEALAKAGFTRIINNRPDEEIPPSHQATEMEQRIKSAGLEYVCLPLTHQTMTPENVARHAEAIDSAPGKVLAYCASGTRCTVVWALGQARAGDLTLDEILAHAQAGGYELGHLLPALQAFSEM